MAVKTQEITDKYAIYQGDCCEVLPSLPDGCVDLSVYSPPFCGLYNDSSDERDMSNYKDAIAVIFTSELANDDPEYGVAARRMEELAKNVPGYLGIESAREGTTGITISYWESEEAIARWRAHPEHLDVQSQGRRVREFTHHAFS